MPPDIPSSPPAGSPPAGPPSAGWYPDPENPAGPRRWWDGIAWTQTRAPGPGSLVGVPTNPAGAMGYPAYPVRPPSRHRFPPLGDLLKFGLESFKALWKPLLIIGALTVGVGTFIYLAATALADFRYEEFDEAEGSFPSEAAIIFGIGLMSFVLLNMYGYLAGSWLVLDRHDRIVRDGRPVRETDTWLDFGDARPALSRSVGFFPRWLGWSLAFSAPFVTFWLLAMSTPLLYLRFSNDEDAGLGALVLLFFMLLASIVIGLPLALVLWVRWGAFLGFAVIDRPGPPFRRSANVSRGQFFVTLGYLLVLLLIVGGVAFAVEASSQVLGIATGAAALSGSTILALISQWATAFVSAVTAVALFVLFAGFGMSCLATLYRTANPLAGDTTGDDEMSQ